jgi:cation transport protein ChaC
MNKISVGPFPELSDRWRRSSLDAALNGITRDEDVWLFAYGSLIWNPCFIHDRDGTATLHGHFRSFSIWTTHARGTPKCPGLGLALEPGAGSCGGRVYRLDRKNRDAGLWTIWQREMSTGIYLPRWLPVQTDFGRIRALCFVADRTHPQYAGAMSPDQIAQASGKFGSCADYLRETVATLAEIGHGDSELEALQALVDERLLGDV